MLTSGIFFKNFKKNKKTNSSQVKKKLLSPVSDMSVKDLSERLGILSICSIGDPQSFNKTIRNIGIKVDKKLIFPDHWPFSEKDIDEINRVSIKDGLESIICTEKDYVKLFEFRKLLKCDIYAVVLKYDLFQNS